MLNIRVLLQCVALVLLLGLSAFADPITFIHTGSGSGTLAGVPFANSAFTITGVGDTSARATQGTAFFIDLTSASINIIGVGNLTFVTGTRFFVQDATDIVGFSRAGSGGADLFDGPSNIVFDTWDMLSSIGPVAGNGNLTQWTSSPVITNGGVLVFNSGTSASTFQAIVEVAAVPEPGSVLLLGTGLGIVGLLIRRRKN
jgi:hypothetical protein